MKAMAAAPPDDIGMVEAGLGAMLEALEACDLSRIEGKTYIARVLERA